MKQGTKQKEYCATEKNLLCLYIWNTQCNPSSQRGSSRAGTNVEKVLYKKRQFSPVCKKDNQNVLSGRLMSDMNKEQHFTMTRGIKIMTLKY